MSALPPLLETDIQSDLRAAVRSLLLDHAPLDRTLASADVESFTHDSELWHRLVTDLGVTALAVPEPDGGVGASWAEAAIVAAEIGRAVAPVPFLSSAGLATALALALDHRELLAELASGAVAAVVIPFAAPVGPQALHEDSGRLTGRVPLVAGVAEARILLVPVGDTVWRVDATGDGVHLTVVPSLDMTRRVGDVELVEAPAVVVAQVGGTAALTYAGDVATTLLAAEQVGLAEWCFEETVEYTKVRRQFGRAIGSYQALKHRLADLWTALMKARAAALYAAVCAGENSDDLPVAAAVAASLCAEVSQRAAEECVQLHGGIGFTWEHPAHLFLKRARADALALGSPTWHRRLLADLVGLSPTPDLPAHVDVGATHEEG